MYTDLHLAAYAGDHEAVLDYIHGRKGFSKIDINGADEFGWTPLHHAAKSGHASVLVTLLQAGADKVARNHEGKTAADLTRSHVVKSILDRTHADIMKMSPDNVGDVVATPQGSVSSSASAINSSRNVTSRGPSAVSAPVTSVSCHRCGDLQRQVADLTRRLQDRDRAVSETRNQLETIRRAHDDQVTRLKRDHAIVTGRLEDAVLAAEKRLESMLDDMTRGRRDAETRIENMERKINDVSINGGLIGEDEPAPVRSQNSEFGGYQSHNSTNNSFNNTGSGFHGSASGSFGRNSTSGSVGRGEVSDFAPRRSTSSFGDDDYSTHGHGPLDASIQQVILDGKDASGSHRRTGGGRVSGRSSANTSQSDVNVFRVSSSDVDRNSTNDLVAAGVHKSATERALNVQAGRPDHRQQLSQSSASMHGHLGRAPTGSSSGSGSGGKGLAKSTSALAGNEPRVGVGLCLVPNQDGSLQITHVVPGGAAAETRQIHAGDQLVSVDGRSVMGVSVTGVASVITGPTGSIVELGVKQRGHQLTVRVTRRATPQQPQQTVAPMGRVTPGLQGGTGSMRNVRQGMGMMRR